MKSKNLNEKEIVRLYTEENKTCKEIGEIFNCNLTTIYTKLKNNNINTSLKGKLKSEKAKRNMRKPKSKPNQNKGKKLEEVYGKERIEEITNKNPNKIKFTLEQEKQIVRLYEKELLESRKIGKIFNCGEKPIFRILKKHDINTKQGHRLKLLIEAGKIPKINKGTFRKGDVRIIGKNNPSYKYDKSTPPLCKCGCGKLTNFNYGLKRFCDYIQGHSSRGSGNPSWQGGISKEPYDQNWTPEFRRFIRKRDNQVCMLCGIHREKLNRALSVHHINSNKMLSIPQNCISLCRRCHNGIVHKDDKNKEEKENWIKLFQEKLTRLYNYQYSENQEIILEANQI